MRAPIGMMGKDTVGVSGKPPIGEEHRLDPLAKLLVRQKQKALA